MLDVETRRRIDTARDILVGKVPDPKSQVEQITIALIYKFMWDIEAQSEELGGERSYFVGEFARYAWPKLMHAGLGGHETLNLYAEALTRIPENPGIPPLFRGIFDNAYLPYRDPETLREFLKVIDRFQYDHSERLGDAFEYLLSVMGAQGDAGQFRTPRHIIDFIVDVVDPQLYETVLDPACGTAGFLISAYKHIRRANTDADGQSSLTPHERGRLAESFTGYDISPDMVRLSLVNMYLHGFVQPDIHEYDTLTSEERWDEYADVILANPPFMSPRGGIRPHSRFSVQSRRSEVLFVDYMAEHLTPTGRAGIIVPEGVIFQSQKAHTRLRQMLVEDFLVAVVSLPAGVFQPYSGVKTSILILDRDLARRSDRIAFFKAEHDGYDLGAQRRPIDRNDLPRTARALKEFLNMDGQDVQDADKATCPTLAPLIDQGSALIVEKERIAESGDYNLSAERYRRNVAHTSAYPMTLLGEICHLTRGVTYRKGDEVEIGGHQVLRANNICNETSELDLSEIKLVSDSLEFPGHKRLYKDDIFICLASGSKDHIGKVALIHNDTNYYFGGFMGTVRADTGRANPVYLFHHLRHKRFNEFLRERIAGANINNLGAKLLYQYAIPLPPLDVQQEIVAEIEGYQKVIDGARTVIDNYRPHIPIDPAWPMVPIGDRTLFRVESGGTPKSSVQEYWNGGVSWATLVDLPAANFITEIRSTKRTISERGLRESSAKLIPENSIIVSTRATIGRIAINRIPMATNQGFKNIVVEDPSRAVPEYVALALTKLIPTMEAWASGGTFKEISKSRFCELQIPLPPLDTQQDFVAEINAEQSLVNTNQKLIDRFEQKVRAAIACVWNDWGER